MASVIYNKVPSPDGENEDDEGYLKVLDTPAHNDQSGVHVPAQNDATDDIYEEIGTVEKKTKKGKRGRIVAATLIVVVVTVVVGGAIASGWVQFKTANEKNALLELQLLENVRNIAEQTKLIAELNGTIGELKAQCKKNRSNLGSNRVAIPKYRALFLSKHCSEKDYEKLEFINCLQKYATLWFFKSSPQTISFEKYGVFFIYMWAYEQLFWIKWNFEEQIAQFEVQLLGHEPDSKAFEYEVTFWRTYQGTKLDKREKGECHPYGLGINYDIKIVDNITTYCNRTDVKCEYEIHIKPT